MIDKDLLTLFLAKMFKDLSKALAFLNWSVSCLSGSPFQRSKEVSTPPTEVAKSRLKKRSWMPVMRELW